MGWCDIQSCCCHKHYQLPVTVIGHSERMVWAAASLFQQNLAWFAISAAFPATTRLGTRRGSGVAPTG